MSEQNLKLVAFCGSLRKASFNRMALHAFTERLAAGVTLSTIEIGDWPLYNADIQAIGFPDKVQAAHKAMVEADGIVFVTPEYNRSIPGVLKNAIDFLYAEWNNKAMGVVSYGVVGGARAAEHLRLVAGELQMADVRTNVALSMFSDFENFTDLKPAPYQAGALDTLFSQVIAWSEALAPLRQASKAA